MTKLILIGAGGHNKVVKDIVAAVGNIELYAIVDDAFNKTIINEDIIYANISFLDSIKVMDYKFCISIGNNNVRKEINERLNLPIQKYITLIHPSAIVSNTAILGNGTVVMPNAVINADVTIGNHCIINTNSVIEHDNTLDDYIHISPGATLSGEVRVGKGTHIGSGAVVIPGKSIGMWTTIGAGAVVVNNVDNNTTAVGIPAKTIK